MSTWLNKKIWILVGTRPEVIKQAPLYMACCEQFGKDQVAFIGTGQHRELLNQALEHFKLNLDVNLDIMTQGQSLSSSSAAVLARMSNLFEQSKPKWLVVQGDTTSAAMAALAAFHNRVAVAHNEAGLRSHNLDHPFPEECNRRIISIVSRLNLAPTELAAQSLRNEGIPNDTIFVTGNTGIDALLWSLKSTHSPTAERLLQNAKGRKLVLMTAHRRENSGTAIQQWFAALRTFLENHSDLCLVYPLHPNNLAKEAAETYLRPLPQVQLCEPLDYATTCHLLNKSYFVVTDSGGIQEEAATLGIPIVVCRQTTERMEAVNLGLAQLAGTNTENILQSMDWAYQQAKHPRANHLKPFGDGLSAPRIAKLLV